MDKICLSIGYLFALLLVSANAAADPHVRVVTEENIYTFTNPNNGSGPLWSYGCTPLVRIGDRVFVAEMETGKDVPPLANTRWLLLERSVTGWQKVAEEEGYRQREPSILATDAKSTVFLNVNESTTPVGTMYGASHPYLLAFNLGTPNDAPRTIEPGWPDDSKFSDHSYRGFAADPRAKHLLMFNIDAKTSAEHWCLLTTKGEVLQRGTIAFPIRACYPQVALYKKSAHILAVSDIVEPVAEWKKYKFEQTKSEWDYVFRILYYAATPDIQKKEFGTPIEIANVDSTAGYIGNQDLWIAPNGDAYIMYTEREVAGALLRDKFFPGKSILASLKLAVVHDGAVTERRVLVEGTESQQPGYARFQVTPEGTVYALVFLTGPQAHDALMQVYPAVANPPEIPVPFKKPFSSFLLASVRAGNAPSNTIDMIGNSVAGDVISYGQALIEK